MKCNASFLCSIILYLLLMFTGCTNSTKDADGAARDQADSNVTDTKGSNHYNLVSEEKIETSYKAQLIEYVWYKDNLY